MKDKKYGIGIVGSGQMGSKHMVNASQIPWFEVRAIADTDLPRARNQAEQLGVSTCLEDYHDLVKLPDVDIVFVCVPAAFHADVAIAAAGEGKHIFCEKPLTLRVADAERMVDAAAKAGVMLAVDFQHRHRETILTLRQLIQEGGLGRPVYYTVHSLASIRPKLAMHDENLNAGPVVDILCHFIDFLRFVFDSEPATVYSRTSTLARGKPQVASVKNLAVDTTSTIVEFDSGDVATLHLCWGLPAGSPSFNKNVAVTPQALIDFDLFGDLTVHAGGSEPRIYKAPESDPLVLQMEHFAKAVRDGGKPTSTGEDGLIALKVSAAALESAKSGRIISLA